MTAAPISITDWLPGAAPPDRLRLFCFPHAGAGAAAFAKWPALAGPHFAVCPVQPPGRAERSGRPPHQDVGALVDDLLAAAGDQFTGRYALFGHSVGALAAFELARRVRTPPIHLFVSGRSAPQLPLNRRPLRDLPTRELIPELRRIGGTPELVLREPELLDRCLPLLRADFAVNETYRYTAREPLAVPLTVFGGLHDPRADKEELRAWGSQSSTGCVLRLFSGGHFFIEEHAREVLATISATLLA